MPKKVAKYKEQSATTVGRCSNKSVSLKWQQTDLRPIAIPIPPLAEQIKIRDPVHGFIHFEGKEIEILNSALLQRLRRIRQLALASLVYPGALHTRFDHTLGVTHVAGQLKTLLPNPNQAKPHEFL